MRAALLGLQRRIGGAGGVVVEGRDIGTVVFPDAEAKFFLTATTDERARRRVAELRAAGKPADEEKTRAELVARDERDSTRAAAPLRRADDAIEIDSSALGPDEVVAKMAAIVDCACRRRCPTGWLNLGSAGRPDALTFPKRDAKFRAFI